MALFSPTFILGVIVLAYLSSFVLFATLRILTGISIQRIGYFSLRRISYTPKAGIEARIRGLGFNLHRPTFAQPTWLSIVLTGLAITVDLKVTEKEKRKEKEESNNRIKGNTNQLRDRHDERTYENIRSKTWQRLNAIKESLKRLHRSVKWIRMADLVVSNTSVSLTDVGTIQIGSFSVVVDTRTRMTGQSRTHSHPEAHRKQNRPAEWVITARSILFTAEGGNPVEMLDHATLNIQGLLSGELDGLRDTSISLKLGRVHIPYDDVKRSVDRYQSYNSRQKIKLLPTTGIFDQVLKNVERINFQEENTGKKFSDSSDLISSILRGIREVQFVASYVGLTKRLPSIQPNGIPICLNMSMKEVGIDLNCLDQKSPAHRMYFSSKDIAHQALVAALSIAIGVDDGKIKTERLAYIPMATTTIRTTFISKIVELSGRNSADERNANMLFANVVITTPSVDLDPRQLDLVLSITKSRPQPMENFVESRKYGLISRLLPKANVKFSMHEPVIRITLPSVEKIVQKDGFDLIISSISSVSLDIESSHSSVGDLHYSLMSTFRLQSHALYYQTFSGAHHTLMTTESFEFKTQINAKSELYVVAAGDLKTFSLHMVHPEINDGIHQIMRQINFNAEPDIEKSKRNISGPNYLRALPAWLVNFSLQINDFSVEVAGIDEEISDEARGILLQLNSWTVEYHASQTENTEVKHRRRYSRSLYSDSEIKYQRQKTQHLKPQYATDGRKLLIQMKDLEVFIIESLHKWEHDPLIAMPKFDCTFSTTSDKHGPAFNIVLYIKYLLIDYSLYRHYSCLVAVMALRRAFMQTHAGQYETEKSEPVMENLRFNDYLSPIKSEEYNSQDFQKPSNYVREQISIVLRATFMQIKAQMPLDPAIMLQIYNIEAGKCSWNSPFLTAKLIRLCAEAPKIGQVWAKIVSIKSFRVDHRESRSAGKDGVIHVEKYIDTNAEATRIAIPHQLVVHQVVDNFVNTLKSVEQLHHRLVTGNKQVEKEKSHVEPKQFPKTLIRVKLLLFELEDGLFEWKLGVIYRTGLLEQAQRLARKAVFDLKARKVKEETRRKLSKHTTKSFHARDFDKDFDSNRPRSRNDEDASILSQRSKPHEYCDIRYNPDGACKITSSAEITSSEAYEKLLRFNSQSWRQRIDEAYSRTKAKMKELRGVFWGIDELPEDIKSDEEILQIPLRPALMEVLISNIYINIEKPTFPLTELPNFINRIGKGMPYCMKYALLIPMHIQIDMEEARATLRDYPLPLIHVPSMKSSQSTRLPAWSLKANFVIGEEFRNNESSRNVKIAIVPPKNSHKGTLGQAGFTVDIYRTISAVKSYSDITVDLNTTNPTHITWGSSFQPAIQDIMMTIETFTKPQIDPSDRIGFWDKIRYSFHSRVKLAWKNDGDVHLLLKGSRDPYEITGNGAGFLMCWRNSVRCDIRQCDDPKKLMTVQSGEYILAVPDFRHLAQKLPEDNCSLENESISDSFKSGTTFKKIIMKLSGNVQWLAGLMFERNIEETGQRSFEFKPHYEIVLKRPDCAKSSGNLCFDAFRGFRSNYIHLSIAVKAPMNRNFPFSDVKRSESYNTVHLSPRFFSHFYAWLSLFGAATSLPIRQGSLWPGIDKSSKKFARHLATIKYNILLAPIFISHVYKHNDTTDFNINADSATGLKIKLENFMLDVHQRKEELEAFEKDHKTQSKTSGMKMHQAQLDLISVDIRAITASIPETSSDKLNLAEGLPQIFENEEKNPELAYFDNPDNDLSWIDKDDLVELDWIRPSNKSLETKILPLTYAPRLTYFRQTDHQEDHQKNTCHQNPFGSEPTHFCTMTKDDDPLWEQYELIKKRKDQLDKQMKSHNISLRDAEIRASQNAQNEKFRAEVEQLKRHSQLFRDKNNFLESMMKSFESCIPINNRLNPLEKDLFTKYHVQQSLEGEEAKTSPSEEFNTELLAKSRIDFNNRFVIHNMQLKWNNLLRNIILRYIHHVSQRRGIVYYLSRRAVKFILDIVQEQKSNKDSKKGQKKKKDSKSTSFAHGHGNDPLFQDVNYHVNEILTEAKKFVNTSGKDSNSCNNHSEIMDNAQISEDFLPINSYHLHLIAPQIQLQSEKNPMAVVLVTAKGMEAKVIEIMDKDRVLDNVSGLVLRKFSVEMESIQFFVTHQKWFSSQLLSMYLGNHYGAPDDSAWPPWVPMEVMFDYEVDPFGFKRVVQKTSASLRYEKYNTLRLEYNDEVSSENSSEHKLNLKEKSRMDRVWVEFPKVHAICNSAQYYAMYIIVMDLLMYSEPQEKTRNELLEKIILASDFSDLRGVPEMIMKLQERIQQLEEIRAYFFVNLNSLDEKGWEDKLLLDRDISSCENELFFMMKAITTYQRKYDTSKTSGLLRWNISSEQIIWHLIRDSNEPLLEFRLQRAEYDRTDNYDGSHNNLIQISKITGLNLLPDAIYPEILAPYFDVDGKAFNEDGNQKMLGVHWYMLEAIAGIPVMDHFSVRLFPMKIQLERDIGKKFFDYIFPGSSDTKDKSPLIVEFMDPIQNDKDENEIGLKNSPKISEDPFYEPSTTSSGIHTETIERWLESILSSKRRQNMVSSSKKTLRNIGIQPLEKQNFRLFQSHQTNTPGSRILSKKVVQLSDGNPPTMKRSESFQTQLTSISDSKAKRFALSRHNSKLKIEKSSDDLTKMMGRASSYMTFANVKINSVVLCLSYKGKSERNFEDIHNLVFRLPDLEYRNKTWSNLDLALAFKRDVIKSLISHTGAIVANKFKHRPNAPQQQRIRELASNTLILTPSTREASLL